MKVKEKCDGKGGGENVNLRKKHAEE